MKADSGKKIKKILFEQKLITTLKVRLYSNSLKEIKKILQASLGH